MNGLIFNIARWRFELKRYYGTWGSRRKPEQLCCTVTSASLLSVPFNNLLSTEPSCYFCESILRVFILLLNFSYSESASACLASIMLHEITAHVAFQVDATCGLSPTRGRSWSSGCMRRSVSLGFKASLFYPLIQLRQTAKR